MSRPVARCAKTCTGSCRPSGTSASPEVAPTTGARASTGRRSRLASGPLRSPIGPFRVTGKATWSSASGTARRWALGRHDAETVAAAMIREMAQLPEHLRRSLTWDRGTELARYDRVQIELGMPVFFCDPHKPWQRGSNENTNRLLRHWLTKGTDLSTVTPADLRRIAATLNARPRPTLDMRTPAQALDALLTDPAAA